MFHPGNPVEGNEQIALRDTVRLLDGRAVPVVNVYGGTVNIKNQFNMTYLPFYIPGAGGVSGYQSEVAYKREIVHP